MGPILPIVVNQQFSVAIVYTKTVAMLGNGCWQFCFFFFFLLLIIIIIRVHYAGLNVTRPEGEIGKYKSIPHHHRGEVQFLGR